MFINRVAGSLDFDFGAGPRYPRVSIPAVAARNAQAAGSLQRAGSPRSVCRAARPGSGRLPAR